MADEPKTAKRDGSAWEAHMERVTARNDAARKAGRKDRAERERNKVASLRAIELRQAAERRRRRIDQAKGSASALHGD